MAYNQITLIGRLTNDLQLSYTSNKISYARATLAVDRNMYNSNKPKVVDFLPFVVWNQNAEYLARYAKKGYLIFLVGELRSNNYLDPETQKQRYTIEINANRVDILTPKNRSNFVDNQNDIQKNDISWNKNKFVSNTAKSNLTDYSDLNNQIDNNTMVSFDNQETNIDDENDYKLNWDDPENI